MIRRLLAAIAALCAFLITVLFASLSVAVAAGATLPPGGSFTDDDGNIHEGSIEAIAAEGITRGCNPPTNDRFCPGDPVTRGQMAAFLNRALDLPATPIDFFVDDDGSTFEVDINRLASAGITRGCDPPDNDRFCPDGFVTRGQMAAFLVRAFGYSDQGAGDLFIDDDGSVFEGDIDKLGTAGVTAGCNPPSNDRYCPNDPVRRDQMASFLTRALGLTPIRPATCVNGWITPTHGTDLRTFPLDMIRVHLGLDADDLFIVNEMRYFVGPEDVEVIAPRRDVERWYVDAFLQNDPSIAGRWIVRRIDIGEGVACEADAGTTGFATGTWWAPFAGGYDPFTPACTSDNGPFCTCHWGVGGCNCADAGQPACTGPPPEVMGCLAGL